jgi:hypothetical protein
MSRKKVIKKIKKVIKKDKKRLDSCPLFDIMELSRADKSF